jgi:hypothetical protein
MAETNTYSHIIQLASSVEPTPELQSYWRKRYEILLTAGVFQLSPKTITAFSDDTMSPVPMTPFGEVDLMNHLDQNGIFDEMKLQITIEYAVRLLDGLICEKKFAPEVFKTLNFYRKIGIGIKNFKEYTKLRPHSSEADQIDYIGHLISSFAYRESENLAAEKGAGGWWNLSRKNLIPRQFELWTNSETRETKTGLELSETFDAKSIMETNWEIQPRRNSHLLILAVDSEWQIWSDRGDTTGNVKPVQNYESSTETTKQVSETSTPETVQKVTLPDISEASHPVNPYLSALEENTNDDFSSVKSGTDTELTAEVKPVISTPSEKLLTTEVIQDSEHMINAPIQDKPTVNTTTKKSEQTTQQPNTISSKTTPTTTSTKKQTINMSKYALTLSKNATTTTFGNVAVQLNYAGAGLKTISITPEKPTPDAQYLLDLVLNLTHFSLSKGVAIKEVAHQIQSTPVNGSTAELINVIVEVLKSAPANISEITAEVVE